VESSYTPDRQQATPRRTPDTPAPPPPPPPTIKAEPPEADASVGGSGDRESCSPRQQIHVKKEFSMEASRESPRSARESPAPERGGSAPDNGSLLALNSMFDQLSGAENNNNNNSGEWKLMNIKPILEENQIRDLGLVLFKAIINYFIV